MLKSTDNMQSAEVIQAIRGRVLEDGGELGERRGRGSGGGLEGRYVMQIRRGRGTSPRPHRGGSRRKRENDLVMGPAIVACGIVIVALFVSRRAG